MTENEILSYCAGVLDSDGFLTIIKHAPNRNFPVSTTFSESIGIGQTSRLAVELFQERWGGRITERRRKGKETWRPMFYWTISTKMASACVGDLIPFLRVKEEQGKIILALRASKSRPRTEIRTEKTTAGGRGVNPIIYAEREELWRRIRALNDNRVRPLG